MNTISAALESEAANRLKYGERLQCGSLKKSLTN